MHQLRRYNHTFPRDPLTASPSATSDVLPLSSTPPPTLSHELSSNSALTDPEPGFPFDLDFVAQQSGALKAQDMPHVLVLGATGTLGSALCRALLRAGHTVYGLARSSAKASSLWQSEIIPVLGSVESPQAILETLRASPEISVVVDAAAVHGESATLLNLFKSAGEERLRDFVKKGVPRNIAPKLGYVYVSGMWGKQSPVTTLLVDISDR